MNTFGTPKTVVLDVGYYYIKMLDDSKEITLIQNAHVLSSENDTKIPLDSKTRKVTLSVTDPKHGIISLTRIYGENVCQMAGSTQGISSRKSEEFKFAFASTLSLKHDGKKLSVVYIHNEEKDFSIIEKSIVGTYKLKINGDPIVVEVVSCKCMYEGLGSYFELKKTQSLRGSTRILDLGFGLANDLIVNEDGKVQYFSTKPELSIFTLARAIETSESFQSYLGSYSSNLTSIAYALEKDQPLGSMPRDEWNKVKSIAISQYYNRLKSHLTAPLSNANLFVNTFVLTGGGSQLLDRENKAFRNVFAIPDNAATASLRGILDHPDIKSMFRR